jgi:hypothetical protein
LANLGPFTIANTALNAINIAAACEALDPQNTSLASCTLISAGGSVNISSLLVDALYTTGTLDFLASLLNVSSLELVEQIHNSVVGSFALNQSEVLMLPSVEINYDDVYIASDGQYIILQGVTASSGTSVYDFGNVTISSAQIESVLTGLFGSETKLYDLSITSPFEASVLHNATSWHALFMFQGYLKQTAYTDRCVDHSKLGSDSTFAHYVARNHPLPLTTVQSLEIQFILSLLSAIFILIALCYAPAAFVTFVVKERACKSKHLQLVSGMYVLLLSFLK